MTRRLLLASLLAAFPVLGGNSQAKRAAKQARRRAKDTKKLAERDVADRQSLVRRHTADRKALNASNAELDKARRQELTDLTRRRQARITRPVVDGGQPAEEPKPGIKPAVRNADPAP